MHTFAKLSSSSDGPSIYRTPRCRIAQPVAPQPVARSHRTWVVRQHRWWMLVVKFSSKQWVIAIHRNWCGACNASLWRFVTLSFGRDGDMDSRSNTTFNHGFLEQVPNVFTQCCAHRDGGSFYSGVLWVRQFMNCTQSKTIIISSRNNIIAHSNGSNVHIETTMFFNSKQCECETDDATNLMALCMCLLLVHEMFSTKLPSRVGRARPFPTLRRILIHTYELMWNFQSTCCRSMGWAGMGPEECARMNMLILYCICILWNFWNI